MKRFAMSASFGSAALVISLVLASQAHGADVPVDLELVLAVDVSGSIDEEEAKLQRKGYLDAITHLQVIDAIKAGPLQRIAISYIEWSGDHNQRTIVDWTLIEDETSANSFASSLSEVPVVRARRTSISAAIDYATNMFDGNGFEGTRQVIDISSDGYNNIGRTVTVARDEAVERGVTINGLPILNDRPNPYGRPPPRDLDDYFDNFVIGGPGSFYIVAENFQDFAAAILNKLIREIAQREPDRPTKLATAN